MDINSKLDLPRIEMFNSIKVSCRRSPFPEKSAQICAEPLTVKNEVSLSQRKQFLLNYLSSMLLILFRCGPASSPVRSFSSETRKKYILYIFFETNTSAAFAPQTLRSRPLARPTARLPGEIHFHILIVNYLQLLQGREKRSKREKKKRRRGSDIEAGF